MNNRFDTHKYDSAETPLRVHKIAVAGNCNQENRGKHIRRRR